MTDLLRTLIVVSVGLALSACGAARVGSWKEARELYDEGEYREAIRRADQVLSFGRASAAERARVNLLKAQSHEKLGELDQAVALYAYVAKAFPEAPEAYQAAVALGRLVPAAPARDEGSGF